MMSSILRVLEIFNKKYYISTSGGHYNANQNLSDFLICIKV